jgi:hypothetical protein
MEQWRPLGALSRWRTERVQLSKHAAASSPLAEARVCERVVVFGKRDLVPEWGIEVRKTYPTPPVVRRVFFFFLTLSRLGVQPFQRAMAAKFPDQRTIFVSGNRPKDLKALSGLLVSKSPCHFTFSFNPVICPGIEIAREHPHIPELNVLVVGMPNVGKSTLLNALRDIGIPGRGFVRLFSFVIYLRCSASFSSDAKGTPHFRSARADESSLHTVEIIG